MGPSTSIKKNDWDIVSLHRKRYEKHRDLNVQYIITFDYARKLFLLKAPARAVAEKIGISLATLKRMKIATGYSNSQLVENHNQFHAT